MTQGLKELCIGTAESERKALANQKFQKIQIYHKQLDCQVKCGTFFPRIKFSSISRAMTESYFVSMD